MISNNVFENGRLQALLLPLLAPLHADIRFAVTAYPQHTCAQVKKWAVLTKKRSKGTEVVF
jgi:hypothetical protein